MERFTMRRKRLHSAGGQEHTCGRCRNAAAFYGLVCILAVAASKMAQTLISEYPAALTRALIFLIPGGAAVFLALACLQPAVETSEYFRVFECLYHPGIWLLAGTSFLGKAGTWNETVAEFLHMAYIAGGTLLAAGIIILILIMKEKHSKRSASWKGKRRS